MVSFFLAAPGRLGLLDLVYRRQLAPHYHRIPAIFPFIGIICGWISRWMLAAAGVLGSGMFWLAPKRYGIEWWSAVMKRSIRLSTFATPSSPESGVAVAETADNIDFRVAPAPPVRDFALLSLPRAVAGRRV